MLELASSFPIPSGSAVRHARDSYSLQDRNLSENIFWADIQIPASGWHGVKLSAAFPAARTGSPLAQPRLFHVALGAGGRCLPQIPGTASEPEPCPAPCWLPGPAHPRAAVSESQQPPRHSACSPRGTRSAGRRAGRQRRKGNSLTLEL